MARPGRVDKAMAVVGVTSLISFYAMGVGIVLGWWMW